MRLAAVGGASLVAGVAATAWTALTLAEFGRFSPALPLLAFPAAAVFAFVLLSRGSRGGGGRVAPEDWVAVAIACSTLLLSLPADEIVLGGQDPGVYVHTAAAVARKGSLLIEEPDVAGLTAGERRLLLNRSHRRPQLATGMWLLPDGRVAPQFYHLYPCLMAVAWSIGGVRAALLVNPLLNVAAVVALYALASLLLGRRWALAAALVHAFAAAQVRQAAFPTAELLAQFFLLSGAALFARSSLDDSPPFLAPLAGVAFGMAMLTRYDSLLFLVPLGLLLVWGMRGAVETRAVCVALGTTAVFSVQAVVHQRVISPVYQPAAELTAAALAAAALLAAAVLLARRSGVWRRLAAAPRLGIALRALAAATFSGWVLFAWFIRPRLESGGWPGRLFASLAGPPPYSGVAGLLVGPESRNMLMLVGVLGTVGAAVAFAGVAGLLVWRRRLWETAWIGASAAVLAVLTANLFHDHYLMWASRRFVPVILPLTSIGVAGAAALVAAARRGRPPALAWAGIALVGTVLALNAGDTAAMARGREWPGLIAWFEELDRALPAGAEVHCRQLGFAAPLRFIYGRPAYEIRQPRRERPGAAGLTERAVLLMRRRAAAGRQVYYLSQEPAETLPRGLVPAGAHPLRSSVVSHSRWEVPRRSRPREVDLVLYRVEPL